MKKKLCMILGTLVILAIGSEHALSTSMLKRNVAKLVQLSEIILVGKVVSVTEERRHDRDAGDGDLRRGRAG